MITSPLFRMRSSAPTCKTIFMPSRLPAIVSPPGSSLQTSLATQWMLGGGKRVHWPALVEKMTHASEDHVESELGGGGDQGGDADRAAWLDSSRGPSFRSLFDSLGERY